MSSTAPVQTRRWRVDARGAGWRLSAFLQARLPKNISGKAIKRAVSSGACRINGRVERFTSRHLAGGDEVTYTSSPGFEASRRLAIGEAGVLYEDEALLLYDKPAGFSCEGHGQRPDLLSALNEWYRDRGGERLWLAHRLDRYTSGALLLVKRPELREPLKAAFRERRIEKTYDAIVDGVIAEEAFEIASHLIRVRGPQHHASSRWRSDPLGAGTGKEAITGFQVVARFANATHVEAYPRTGRTHQIRVHLSERGNPVVGDRVYGTNIRCKWPAGRQLLHARRLCFEHPHGGKRLEIEAPLPADFRAALSGLGLGLG